MNGSSDIAILGHWGGNIGHEVMAIGVQELVSAAFPGKTVRRIEQHRPFDVYSSRNPLRHVAFLRHARGGALWKPLKVALNSPAVSSVLWRFADVSNVAVAVACGGPVLGPHFTEGDLALMYQHLHGAFTSRGCRLVNLSVGACYPFETATLPRLTDEQAAFVRRMFALSTVTTVRDPLALQLCRDIGLSPELVPDTGFLAGREFIRRAPAGVTRDVVAISYQRLGANEDWGQGVDAGLWAQTVRETVDRLRRRHKVVFICHDRNESALAERLAASVPRFEPKTAHDYAAFAARVKTAICNRLHAAIALAGTGVPVIGVGTDTRLKTLELVGLPTSYVKRIGAAELESKAEEFVSGFESERARLLQLHDQTLRRYVEMVR